MRILFVSATDSSVKMEGNDESRRSIAVSFLDEETGNRHDEVGNECCCEAQSDCEAWRFSIDRQVAWISGSAPARLVNYFQLPACVSHNESMLLLK